MSDQNESTHDLLMKAISAMLTAAQKKTGGDKPPIFDGKIAVETGAGKVSPIMADSPSHAIAMVLAVAVQSISENDTTLAKRLVSGDADDKATTKEEQQLALALHRSHVAITQINVMINIANVLIDALLTQSMTQVMVASHLTKIENAILKLAGGNGSS